MSCTDFLFYEFLSEPEGQWSCYSQADMGLERKKRKEGLFASQHCFFTVFHCIQSLIDVFIFFSFTIILYSHALVFIMFISWTCFVLNCFLVVVMVKRISGGRVFCLN